MDKETILRGISENLRIARLRKRYTQDEIAERADTSQRYLSNIELGKSDPSITKFIKICEALEVDPAEMLKFDRR